VAEQLKQERGMTAKMIVDNGPEFLSRVVDQWAYENGVEFHFIEPGKPTQNAYFESFIAGGYCPVTQLTRAVESDPRRDYEFPVIRRLSDAGNDGPGAISRDISSCRISCHSFFCSGVKIIVRGAGLPGRRAGRVSRGQRSKVIR
jgi:transposase InsO family protein